MMIVAMIVSLVVPTIIMRVVLIIESLISYTIVCQVWTVSFDTTKLTAMVAFDLLYPFFK